MSARSPQEERQMQSRQAHETNSKHSFKPILEAITGDKISSNL